MKIAKFITTFLLLFVLGMFISYANVIYNNWTNDFIEAFEQTDAKFKFYNIKINTVVPDIKSEEEIKQICIDIMNCFNISENKIKTIMAVAHTDLGVLKLSDVVKRLLSETD